MITLRQLEIFRAAARHGSFRRCAEQVGLSQVAVSEHIRMLEDRLGCTLFERRPGGPALLTDVGQLAYERVSSILTDIDDFIDEIGERGGRDQQTISVAIPGFLMRNLYEAINAFTQSRPAIQLKLDLHDYAIADVLERLKQRLVDLVYLYVLEEADAPGTKLLRHEPLAVFVAATHPLARQRIVSAAALREVPVVHLTEGSSLRLLVDRALRSVGADGSPVAIESHDFGVLLSSLQRNQGYICMFRATEAEMAALYDFVRVEVEPPLPSLQVRVAARSTGTHIKAIREIREIIGTAETEQWAGQTGKAGTRPDVGGTPGGDRL